MGFESNSCGRVYTSASAKTRALSLAAMHSSTNRRISSLWLGRWAYAGPVCSGEAPRIGIGGGTERSFGPNPLGEEGRRESVYDDGTEGKALESNDPGSRGA